MAFTRRQFIRIGSAGAGVALASGATTNWWNLYGGGYPDPKTDGDRVVPTFCELCFWKCGVLAHVKDGRVTKITGNPDHPLSRGRLCPRGVGGTGLLYDPDRLKTPLIRARKRGEDVFQQASWGAALDETAARMDAIRTSYGPEAFALFTHGWGGSWFTKLTNAYGSPNIGAPSYAQCRGPREAGFALTFGQALGSPEPLDIENARCITLIGSHLGENMHNTQVQELSEALGRGAGLVVVDPRFSVAASKATYWLPIKPSTDTALLLSWMNVIIAEKRYDAEYVAKHTIGFDQLAAHVATKTPEWAYPITGLRPELIRDSARLIASARPASLIHPGRHATWYGDDSQRSRAVAILAALLGSWGRGGGYILPGSLELPKYPTPATPVNGNAVDRADPGLYPFSDEVLASGLCDATMPGMPKQMKGWMVYGTNLIQSLPDPPRTIKAIQELDFIVTIDVLPMEITGWSDVVLPESTYLERFDDLWAPAWKEPFIAVRQPAVEPMYDSRPGWWIAKELAARLGLAEFFPWKDPVEHAAWRAEAAGHDFGELLRRGVITGKPDAMTEDEGLALTFETPSRKIELFSQQLADSGFDPIPEYRPHPDVPAGMFRLLSGRAAAHTFGRTTNNRFLAQVYPENEVWVNADAARSIAGFEEAPLRNGDYVVLENQDGVRSLPVRAKVTERIRGDAVFLVHGFGHTAKGLAFAKGRGACDSGLTTKFEVDPIMGGTGMNVNFVRILRAEA